MRHRNIYIYSVYIIVGITANSGVWDVPLLFHIRSCGCYAGLENIAPSYAYASSSAVELSTRDFDAVSFYQIQNIRREIFPICCTWGPPDVFRLFASHFIVAFVAILLVSCTTYYCCSNHYPRYATHTQQGTSMSHL